MEQFLVMHLYSMIISFFITLYILALATGVIVHRKYSTWINIFGRKYVIRTFNIKDGQVSKDGQWVYRNNKWVENTTFVKSSETSNVDEKSTATV
jgi:hypothetical protein